MITEVSQEGNFSLVNLEALFRRSDLTFRKLGEWSKKMTGFFNVETATVDCIK